MRATTFLSVRIPESESRRVKVLAATLGLSLQDVIRQALDAWVLEHDPQARRRRERQERQAGFGGCTCAKTASRRTNPGDTSARSPSRSNPRERCKRSTAKRASCTSGGSRRTWSGRKTCCGAKRAAPQPGVAQGC